MFLSFQEIPDQIAVIDLKFADICSRIQAMGYILHCQLQDSMLLLNRTGKAAFIVHMLSSEMNQFYSANFSEEEL